ncbi:hypothetical protein NliqN6_6612 [Naganishia liquefaciens]|uniref:Mediator of RNA polymerase II transcription subunit 6 n=1 Tax=Naganishia liquefaciens TaxID=104408 RepID=A0A8H3U0F2_9TREE|nr:hypothetical protein NliqN6_6612 [Naganishia liquefaciens]
MTDELDLAPDLASQQWWDDNWVQVAAGGSLTTPTLAWRYFATSIFIDHETDNWGLYVQFSEDASFDWSRMEETMSTMFGKQYRFNFSRCQPPNYWVIEKVHKYQQKVRNDLGQQVTVIKERLLEVFVIVDRKVMKCSTLYDLANVRMLGAMHALSTTLESLRSNIPAPSVRETSFWQSSTIKIPEEKRLQDQVDEGMQNAPKIEGEGPTEDLTQQGTKNKRKRPDPYQLTILHAMQTTQNAIPAIIDPGMQSDTLGIREIKTKEEEQADRLMRMIREPGGEAHEVASGGVKRAIEESLRGIAKQARFQI